MRFLFRGTTRKEILFKCVDDIQSDDERKPIRHIRALLLFFEFEMLNGILLESPKWRRETFICLLFLWRVRLGKRKCFIKTNSFDGRPM